MLWNASRHPFSLVYLEQVKGEPIAEADGVQRIQR